MKYQGVNLENVKSNNQSAIIRLLHDNGPMSRKDIAEAVGLTAASVTLICTELIEKNVIVELGEVTGEKRAGRKKILIDINSEYKKAMCIAMETDATYISLADIKGNIQAAVKLDIDWDMEPEEHIKRVAKEAKKLLSDNDITGDRLLGVCATVPGKVDPESGVSISAKNVWGREVPVVKLLGEQMGTEVVLENNLKAAAQYELLFGKGKSEKNLLLLKWGPGVGSAVIIDSKIYNGAGNAAGEIGHTTLGNGDRQCTCGKRGCLETYISNQAILKDIEKALGNAEKYREDPGLLGGDEVRDLMDEKIKRLAQTLTNAVSLIDPDRVIVLGYIFEVPGLLERFKKLYKTYDSTREDDFIVMSELGSKSGHIEPLAVLLNKAINYNF